MGNNIKRFFNNLSLRNKIFLSFISLLLLVVACLLSSFIYLANSDAQKNMMYSASTALTQTKSFLDFKTESVREIMNVFSFNEILQKTLKTSPLHYENNVGVWKMDCEELESQFYTLQTTPDINAISLYMKEGPAAYMESEKLFSLSNYMDTDFYENYSFSSRKLSWYKGQDFTPGSSPDNIIVLKNIINYDNYQDTIGILRFEFSSSIFSDILNQSKPSQNTISFLTDGSQIIAHSDFTSPTDDETIDSVLDYVSSLTESAQYPCFQDSVMLHDKEYIVCIDIIKRTNWKFILLIPLSDIQLSQTSTISITLYISLMVLILSIIITLGLSKNFTKRLTFLSKQMKNIDDSSVFFDELSPTSRDEIGILSQNFNYMLFKISVLLDEKYKLGQEVKNAELIALQEQINPHFLYNTLDQIYWLGVKNKAPEISSLVLQLSKFYRLSLSKGKNIVPLSNELEHIQTYVAIQNFRYDNMIALNIEISEEALPFELPKLTLQPIVENAILHGICEKDELGTITIKAQNTNNKFSLDIIDDGIGMDSDTLDHLFDTDSSSHGYGLKNVMKRLKLIYADKVQINVSSTPDQGTTVSIEITYTPK